MTLRTLHGISGIDHVKGALEVGKHADIAVHDAGATYVYDASTSGHNVVGWSPYNGITLPYRVAATYLRGKLAFDGSRRCWRSRGPAAFVQTAAGKLVALPGLMAAS